MLMLMLLVFNKELCCGVYMNKRGLSMLHEIGLAALILIARRFENSANKKKTRKRGFFMLHEIGLAALILKSSALKIVQIKKNTQARLGVFFYLHYLFVTQRGFEPPTVRAEI
jgi:hypothetical protein